MQIITDNEQSIKDRWIGTNFRGSDCSLLREYYLPNGKGIFLDMSGLFMVQNCL